MQIMPLVSPTFPLTVLATSTTSAFTPLLRPVPYPIGLIHPNFNPVQGKDAGTAGNRLEVSGLQGGTEYRFKLAARNNIGTGAAGPESVSMWTKTESLATPAQAFP